MYGRGIKEIVDKIDEYADGRRFHWVFIIFARRIFLGDSVMSFFQNELYKYNRYERKQFWTARFQKKQDKLWNSNDNSVLTCREKTNRTFKKFISRDWLYVPESSLHDFKNFIEKHHSFILKKNWCAQGIGIEKVSLPDNLSEEELTNLYVKYKESFCMLEEIVRQHAKMKTLSKKSVNTIRVATYNNAGNVFVVATAIRCGKGKSVTDNLQGGGLCAAVDAKSGIIKSYGFDEQLDKYLLHPDTGAQILGFNIPHWNKVLETAIEAHKLIPEIKWVGWDIAITEDGVELIEGNKCQGQHLILTGNIGLHRRFRELGIKENKLLFA